MNIANRLSYLRGKVWMYNTLEHHVIDTMVIDDNVIISTDKGMLKIPLDEAQEKLTEFHEIHKEPVRKNGNGSAESNTLPEIYKRKEVGTLFENLIDNIDKVKADKKYIPVANSVNQSISTMINLFKLELEVKKMELKEGFQ